MLDIQELEDILRSPDPLQHYGVEVDVLTLADANPEGATQIIQTPLETLPFVEEALITAQNELLAKSEQPDWTTKVMPLVALHFIRRNNPSLPA
jgi:hypothetical protein